MIIQTGYDFDDLLLVPQPSSVLSRDDVDLSMWLSDDFPLSLPIIGSPMKGIMSKELAYELYKHGGIGILHRFYASEEERVADIAWLHERAARFGIAIGLKDELGLAYALDVDADIICIDVANGYLQSVIEFTEYVASMVQRTAGSSLVMVGNVVDDVGAYALQEAGADLIRVGIGSGGLCTTRNMTGVGMPQLSAISLASQVDVPIVADGGIRNSGDAMKAIAMGANAVMVGSLLAVTYEAAHDGIIMGMASRKMQEEYYFTVKSVEGLTRPVEKIISADALLTEFMYNMQSACTYLNCRRLEYLHLNSPEWVTTGSGSIKQL